jgi:hypothetical protein
LTDRAPRGAPLRSTVGVLARRRTVERQDTITKILAQDPVHGLGLNRRLSGIKIMTYDHLLAQGERLLEMLQHGSNESEPVEDIEFDDDIPF